MRGFVLQECFVGASLLVYSWSHKCRECVALTSTTQKQTCPGFHISLQVLESLDSSGGLRCVEASPLLPTSSIYDTTSQRQRRQHFDRSLLACCRNTHAPRALYNVTTVPYLKNYFTQKSKKAPRIVPLLRVA